MLSTIKNTLFAAAVLVPAAFTTHTASAQSETFRISNESSYRIDHVYMTSSGYNRWGGDVLYGYLHPDHQLDLQVEAGRYDVKVVDSDGDSCVIAGVDVYEGEVWHLTNSRLLACEFNSR
jgi:hypothetical protein